jgi:PAS domain S-box-containing protein
MQSRLRVLHLEDDIRDTELVQAVLETEGIATDLKRVEAEHDFLAALKSGSFDVILADYTLPSFDGLSALTIAQQHAPDVPFLFVSATLGEDVAIEALKRGATDYVLKTRLARLGPSVTRALREAQEKAERKRAEQAVRRSEKQLRDLIETIPAMAFVTQADGTNEFVSRQWIEFSGLSAEQSSGGGWEVTLHPDDREQHLEKWRVSWTTGQPFENEARHRDAQGNYRWLLVRAVPLRNEHGNTVKWYGAAIDVEDRKRAEEQVRRSEAYLAEAQRLTHTGSRAHKPGMSKPFYWSEEMFRILGFDPDQGLPDNETVWQRVHPEDSAFLREQIDKLSSGNLRTDIANDYRIVLPNGIVKYIHGRSHPVFDEAGNVIEYVGTSVDVTDRKRAEALQTGERRLLEMIATGVSLRKILNELCLIIEEQMSGTLASILLLDPGGLLLKVVAAPNLPNEWTQQMEKIPIGPCAGSCGTAAYRGSPVIVSDLATDPLWDVPEYRASALEHGLRASWSNPVLSSQGKVLGTLCIDHRESGTPTSQDFELIQLATHLTRVAIERDRAEEALRASEQLARSHVEVMMRSLDVLATEAAPEKFIGEIVRTIGQQLHAIRVWLWLRNQQDDSLDLHLLIENDKHVPPDPEHPFVKDPHAWREGVAFIREMLLRKRPVVCNDVDHDSRISPEFHKYVTKRGWKRFMTVPMFVSGELRGFIGIQHADKGTYRDEEIELAQALAHHVMLAVHGAELAEQRRHAVILEERTRMARDIHDTLAQGFTGVIVQLDTAVEALRDEEPEATANHIGRARELARESLSEARRSVHALRPQALERAELADALKAIITNTTAGTSLHSDFELNGEPCKLQPAVEENLLHIGQEALTNALKHACATRFHARLSFDADAVRLELCDNGQGFVVDSVNGRGVGLIGMKERAQQIGATLAVTSKPGQGTAIVAVSAYPAAVTT